MKITLNPNSKDAATRDALVAEGGFGKYYTDHMVMCEWSEKDGWGEPHLMPYGPISLDPATAVFHYGQEVDDMVPCQLFGMANDPEKMEIVDMNPGRIKIEFPVPGFF